MADLALRRAHAVRIAGAALLAVVLHCGGGAAVANPRVDPPPAARPFAVHVADAAQRFGIPEGWIWAVMRAESGGDVGAVSHAGAMGLMQLMPGTWAALRARHGLGADPYDARDNIMAGAAYLRAMHDRYGNPVAMVAAYNAGPGRYDDYLLRGRPLPAETRAYVATLAPSISGVMVAHAPAVAPPDPLAWTRAALFAARSDGVPPSRTVVREDAADTPPEPPPSNGPDIALAAIEPPSTGIFVPLSGRSPQ